MKICIAGSGSLGSLYSYKLAKAGEDVTMLSFRENRISNVKNNGIPVEFNGQKDNISIKISHPDSYIEKPDLVIFLVKAMQLERMTSAIQKNFSAETKAICLMNGLELENILKKYIPEKNIIMGATIWSANINKNGLLNFIDKGAINFQCINNTKESAKSIINVFEKANMNPIYDNNIKEYIWQMAALNGTFNPVCALEDCNIGYFLDSEYGQIISKKIINEFYEVGKAEGISLDKEYAFKYLIDSCSSIREHYPSMHQDLIQNHRPTEISFINMQCVNIGKRHNIESPVNELLSQLVLLKQNIL